MTDHLTIPTRFKSRLRRGLSYPIGAEVISEMFGDLTPLHRLELSFWIREPWLAGNIEAVIRRCDPYTILRVGYQNLKPGLSGSNDDIRRGWYGQRWDLQVHAVPSVQRHAVRSCLLEGGLELAHDWLRQERPPTWLDGRHRLNLTYDPGMEAISVSDA